MEMIRRRNGQRSLWDAVLFGAPDPRALMDPVLRRIDELLEDEVLVDSVVDRMRERFPKSSQRGRRGTPAEVALRMLVLKHLKKWSYEELEWEVMGNLVYRYFCRIDGGKVPEKQNELGRGSAESDRVLLEEAFDAIVLLYEPRIVDTIREPDVWVDLPVFLHLFEVFFGDADQ